MNTGIRFNPWRRLRELQDWRLVWRSDLPADMYGYTHFASRTIVLSNGLSFEERRCTIAHEVEHVRRGLASRCDVLAEEAAVDRVVSRTLLPEISVIADALIYNGGDYEATGSDLWVDVWTLETRLGALDPAEATYLRERLSDVLLVQP